MRNIEKAKDLLYETQATCVVMSTGREPFVAYEKGIKPMMDILKQEGDLLKDATVADKVIGKAAAFLAITGGVKEIYADIISEPAIKVLEEYKVMYEYRKKVEFIINRSGDGKCPMESAVLLIGNPEEAYRVLKMKMKEMGIV